MSLQRHAWNQPDLAAVPPAQLVRVGDIMRRDYIQVTPSEDLLGATRLMRLARVRHLPVLEDGVLEGVISHRDLLESCLGRFEALLSERRRAEVMSAPIEDLVERDVQTVTPDCTLDAAAMLMIRGRIGFLPVVEEGERGTRVVGLVTESDLLRAAYDPSFF